MYRWQTLTLARLETLSQNAIPSSQYEAVRNLLFAIGSRHFPEPSVSYLGSTETGAYVNAYVNLTWVVDDREWQVSVDGDGTCKEVVVNAIAPDNRIERTFSNRGTDYYAEIKSRVQWLLLGYTIGPVADAKAPA